MKINFYLLESTTTKKPVYLFISFKGQRKKICPPLFHIIKKDWDSRKQRVKSSLSYSLHCNNILNDIEAKLLPLDVPNTTWPLLEDLFKPAEPIEEVKEPAFFDLYKEYIKDSESRVSDRGNMLTPGSILTIKGCMNTLQEFEDKTGYKLSLASLDNNFYSKFRTYCLVDRETPYSVNTFGGKVKKLKAFLQWCATVKKLAINLDKQNFKAPSFYGQEIDSLLPDELEKLWTLDLGKDQWKLDIFLFLCSTGMRFSDYKKIRVNFDKHLVNSPDGKAIVFQATKTNCTCIVPFADDLYFRPVFLYEKYEGKLPLISEQKLNDFLQKSGLITRFSPSTKIGRKTLASIKYFHLHLDAQFCMPIGGWKTEKEFRRYAGADITQILKANKEKSTFLKVS